MSAFLDFSELLQSSNLKKTGHRLEILTLLEGTEEPLSADKIHDKLHRKGVHVPYSTIYRTLETLSSNNIISKLRIEKQQRTLFELNRNQHHHHLICLGCEKIIAVEGCPIPEAFTEKIQKEQGFEILGHRLEFFGYCPECQKKLLNVK
ncbi:MAG TPA: transcriptional repressor [Bacillota bacterium]|mgnify:CR=1 FL=1|nr:transcriptional repressor [Bacillota bacterium]HPJ85834.1 transcriptional repressor [Bacillota bacterium]HRX91892.1 transcriptional repressor [Candidatus Izemoplasmatales bacterium]